MTHEQDVMGNYLRAHRRSRGLSQLDLGRLVGYGHAHAISKHERSKSIPPLLVALAYEVLYEIPVGQLFTGFRLVVAQSVARNIQDLKMDIGRSRRRSNPEKTKWLTTQRIG
jgi:transcriptional regulator with XRE-family HTH domain